MTHATTWPTMAPWAFRLIATENRLQPLHLALTAEVVLFGHMERPVYLREDAYETILSSLADLNDAAVRATLRGCGYDVPDGLSRDDLVATIMETPSQFLFCRCDVLSRPDLLSGLFIEFNDDELDAGLTYWIDREAAEEIASVDATVLLRSGRGGALVPRTRIKSAFANGCTIDYREGH